MPSSLNVVFLLLLLVISTAAYLALLIHRTSLRPLQKDWFSEMPGGRGIEETKFSHCFFSLLPSSLPPTPMLLSHKENINTLVSSGFNPRASC